MALAEVKTSSVWLASADKADFNHSIDINRYKNFTASVLANEKPKVDEGILNNLWNTLSNAFAGITSLNRTQIMDMIKSAIDTVLGIGGSLLDMLGIRNALNTVCGSFDAGMFNRHGGSNFGVSALGLMGLLSALLCMGVNLALSAVAAIAKGIGMVVSGLVSVVSMTLDSLVVGPIKSVTDAIGGSSFVSSVREYTDSKIDINGMLSEITTVPELSSVFKNTDTAQRLLSGFSGDSSKFSGYVDTLMPNWDVKDLGGSLNAGKSFLTDIKSTALNDISSLTPSLDKKDFMMMLL